MTSVREKPAVALEKDWYLGEPLPRAVRFVERDSSAAEHGEHSQRDGPRRHRGQEVMQKSGARFGVEV